MYYENANFVLDDEYGRFLLFLVKLILI